MLAFGYVVINTHFKIFPINPKSTDGGEQCKILIIMVNSGAGHSLWDIKGHPFPCVTNDKAVSHSQHNHDKFS